MKKVIDFIKNQFNEFVFIFSGLFDFEVDKSEYEAELWLMLKEVHKLKVDDATENIIKAIRNKEFSYYKKFLIKNSFENREFIHPKEELQQYQEYEILYNLYKDSVKAIEKKEDYFFRTFHFFTLIALVILFAVVFIIIKSFFYL